MNTKLVNTPAWWLYDDAGEPIFFHGNASTCGTKTSCAPYLNYSIPEAGDWWMTRPMAEVCGPNAKADAALLIDGMMMDGAGYANPLGYRSPTSPTRGTSTSSTERCARWRTRRGCSMNGGEAWSNPFVPRIALAPFRPAPPYRHSSSVVKPVAAALWWGVRRTLWGVGHA